MRSSLTCGALAGLLFSPVAWASAPELGVDPVQPQVYGGTPAEVCQWPTTVAVTGGGGLCTGALVHPRVVTYAAHCGGGSKQIKFGESSTQAITRHTERCVVNPEYLGTSNQAQDWAFCILQEPMLDIPFTPPLYGCELSMIEAGREVILAGYGDSNVGGAGTKRWGESVIVSTFGGTVNIGAGGTGVSTCQGDSGGTAYVLMDDGSYRAISMVSTGLQGCNDTTGVHALMHPAVPWIEENAQIDITPCHDADGTWHPNPNCTGFFAGGSTPSGNWENMCAGTPASGPAATCGDSFEATPDSEPPVVTIASPSHREEFESGARVTIDIDAVDEGYGVSEVWLEIGGMVQGVRDTYPPFQFADVPFPDGVYTIVAYAVDWAGNEAASAPVTIGINAEVPDDSGGSESDGDTEGGGSASESGGTSSAGETDDPGVDDGGPEGCSCSARPRPGAAPWALLLLGLGLRRRTRGFRPPRR
jgi:MYXO-CTERM domain-containing protein